MTGGSEPDIARGSHKVQAILWDADGVLQHNPVGWVPALDQWGGAGFAEAVFAAEGDALVGRRSMRACLEDVLRDWPSATATVEDLLGLWERTQVDPAGRALVGRVRGSGVRCVLATNQQDHRRAWMRDRLDWDGCFDAVIYSCEIGVAKPDPAYFEHALSLLDLPAFSVGFLDDNAANVAAAAALGIRAVLHDPAGGVATLEREVAGLVGA